MFNMQKMGFVRVGAVDPVVELAQPQVNAARIYDCVRLAEKNQIKILLFPELCLTGYTCADLFHQRILLDETKNALKNLLRETANVDILFAVGLPVECDNQLFNCAAILHRGRILGLVPKTFIPNYNEFYEKRWFSPSRGQISQSVTLCGQEVPFGQQLLFQEEETQLCLAAEICEDLWMPIPPSSYHAIYGANLILNLSASNELVGKMEYRRELVLQQAARSLAAYVYASSGVGESSTDVVFSGHLMIAENGVMLSERRFEEAKLLFADLDIEKLMNERRKINSYMGQVEQQDYRIVPFVFQTEDSEIEPEKLQRWVDPYPFVPGKKEERDLRCSEIFTIQTSGLMQRLKKTRIKKVVLGISGGLDSTLALLVCHEAFERLGYDKKNICGVTMPGLGTTERTKNNAWELMRELGVNYREIPIIQATLQHFKDISHDPAIEDITYENVQARERTQVLMDIANEAGGLVVGTGDLSELALGWCTYNGDHMSHYAVNVSIPKTLVQYLIGWYADTTPNPNVGEVLRDILATPISPELLPPDPFGTISQKTEDVIGPYALHDFFLYYMMRWGFTPSKVYFLACKAFAGQFDKTEIYHWLKVFYLRFFTQQFKRSCLPDGPKVGSICLSPRGDWRMPSDADPDVWLKDLESIAKC